MPKSIESVPEVSLKIKDSISFSIRKTWKNCVSNGYAWYQKQKYLKMTKMLTYQISEVKEPVLKERLKVDISKNAKMLGVEHILRKMLDEQGLLHKST